MTTSFIRAETHRGVRVLYVENPPVNALSPGVPEALMAAVDEANADPDVTAGQVSESSSATPPDSLILQI